MVHRFGLRDYEKGVIIISQEWIRIDVAVANAGFGAIEFKKIATLGN